MPDEKKQDWYKLYLRKLEEEKRYRAYPELDPNVYLPQTRAPKERADFGGMVTEILRGLPIPGGYYWKTPKEKTIDLQKEALKKAGFIESEIEDMMKKQPGEREMRAYTPKPGSRTLPFMPSAGIGEQTTAGERFVGEWVGPAIGLGWVPIPIGGALKLAMKGGAKVAKPALKPVGKAVGWATKPLSKAYMEAETITTARAAAAQEALVATGQPFKGIGYRGVGKSGVETPRIHGVSDSYAVGMPKTPAAGKTTAEHFAAGVQNQTLKGGGLKAKVVEAKGIVTKKAIDLKNPYVTDPYGDDVIKAIAEKAQKQAKVKGLFGKDFDNYTNTAIEKELGKRGFDGRVVKYAEEGYYEVIEFPKSVVKKVALPKEIFTGEPREPVAPVRAAEVEPTITGEVHQIAVKSSTRSEFFEKLHAVGFQTTRKFENMIKREYKSVDNYLNIAKAEDLQRRTQAILPRAVDKIKAWIKSSTEKWEPTKAIWTKERGIRFAKAKEAAISGEGKEAYTKAVGKMAGEYPISKPMAPPITKVEQKALYDAINIALRDGRLGTPQYLNANEGLGKILAHRLPQTSEMIELEKVFGGDLIDLLLSKRSVWRQNWEKILDVALLPRTLLASGDFSAPLRQGLFLLPSHPIKGFEAFTKSVRMFFDKQYYDEVIGTLARDPYSSWLANGGLEYTSLAKTAGGVLAREEAFMSRIAERLLGVGRLVKASERAYVGFLDMFRHSIAKSTVQGWGMRPSMALTDDVFKLTKYVNWATGRGWQPPNGELLNAIFFSPRLQTARIGLPGLIVKMLVTDSPALKKVAARDLTAFLGAVSTALYLAHLGGAEVELDPRAADFGKARWGNTRWDLLGGFGQYAVLASRMLSGNIEDGRLKASSGMLVKSNRLELLTRFVRTKGSPAVGAIVNTLAGSTVIGEEINLDSENVLRDLRDNLIPMAWQDIWDAAEENGITGGLMGLPGIFGVGVQTYDSAPQMVGEVRYWHNQWQEANSELRKMQMKGEFDKISKFRENHPELMYGRMVSDTYNRITKIERAKEEIELSPYISDESKKDMLNMMELQQIEMAIPALLAIESYKLAMDGRKVGLNVNMPRGEEQRDNSNDALNRMLESTPRISK